MYRVAQCPINLDKENTIHTKTNAFYRGKKYLNKTQHPFAKKRWHLWWGTWQIPPRKYILDFWNIRMQSQSWKIVSCSSSIVSTFKIETDISRFMLGLKYYKRIGNNNDMWYAFYYNHFNQHLSSLKWIGVFIILVLSIEIFIYSFHKTILI